MPSSGQIEPTAAPSGADDLEAGAARLARRLGHEFSDLSLLRQALAHRSWCGERLGAASNERLEFLGDAVLGLAVARFTYGAYPDLPEGQLAKVRAAVVNARVLAEVAEDLDLGDELLLGRGEESSGGRTKGSLLADAVEAVIGAVYLDADWETAESLVLRLLGPRIEKAAIGPDDFDHKSRLQEWSVRAGYGPPRYVVEGSGPDHDRHYVAQAFVGAEPRGSGEGGSKKDAEQEAAGAALATLAELAKGTELAELADGDEHGEHDHA